MMNFLQSNVGILLNSFFIDAWLGERDLMPFETTSMEKRHQNTMNIFERKIDDTVSVIKLDQKFILSLRHIFFRVFNYMNLF